MQDEVRQCVRQMASPGQATQCAMWCWRAARWSRGSSCKSTRGLDTCRSALQQQPQRCRVNALGAGRLAAFAGQVSRAQPLLACCQQDPGQSCSGSDAYACQASCHHARGHVLVRSRLCVLGLPLVRCLCSRLLLYCCRYRGPPVRHRASHKVGGGAHL